MLSFAALRSKGGRGGAAGALALAVSSLAGSLAGACGAQAGELADLDGDFPDWSADYADADPDIAQRQGGARWLAPEVAERWELLEIAAHQRGGQRLTQPDDFGTDAPVAGPPPTQPADSVPQVAAVTPLVQPTRWADHVPREYATHPTFGSQVGAIKTEALLMFGYFTIRAGTKLFGETEGFHFKDEGWFGKDTEYVGVDKFAHAWNTYLAAEILHNRLHRKANASEGDAVTAATLAFGFVAYNEISDAIEPDSGWSWNDILMNGLGAGFSVIRNTVPGVKEKLAFKIEIMPNEEVWTYSGPKRFEQQRFFFALKGSGFRELHDTPLRYLDLQVGYFGSDFEPEDREAGLIPKRHPFVGVGLNVGELLFGGSNGKFGKAAWSALDYAQIPYTSLRVDQRGDLVF
jgi:hypothetical protein